MTPATLIISTLGKGPATFDGLCHAVRTYIPMTESQSIKRVADALAELGKAERVEEPMKDCFRLSEKSMGYKDDRAKDAADV